jgi:hypothetical protein
LVFDTRLCGEKKLEREVVVTRLRNDELVAQGSS